ncbi:MAG: TraB/GumN family protein [Lewinellaceae bacterium]|nr:TraB/GumN family protein [Lewinellaceae bacterium]
MKKSLLWRITPPGGGPDSYLFGTMHVRDLRAFTWLEPAQAHLAQCDVFATEFDFNEIEPAVLQEALRLPEGQTLDTLLKPGVWKNLDRYARKKLGLTAETFRHQHPMSVSTALTAAFLMDEAPQSLDETLWNHARLLGKQTAGVETFADQLLTLRTITLEQHLKSLTWLLKNFNRQKKRLKKMMAWYVAGDMQPLYKAAKKDAKGMRKVLIYRRNKRMTQRFEEMAATQALFCAVGAGHLPGGKGMLSLLRKKGFVVKPVLFVENVEG